MFCNILHMGYVYELYNVYYSTIDQYVEIYTWK